MTSLTHRSNFPATEGSPVAGFSLLEDALNHFFHEPPTMRPWSPAVDIIENENELVLMADVPGIRMEDIEIKMVDDTLTLSGKREFQTEDKSGGYHRLERSYGTFQRAFVLADSVDAEHVSASYDNGVLRVTLPKKERAKPRTIKVAVGSTKQ